MKAELKNYTHLLIIDVESTCDNKGTIPVAEMETIQIGAVLVDLSTYEVTNSPYIAANGEFSEFIKPTLHPTLTSFAKKLTGIKQADVNTAKTFPYVLKDLSSRLKDTKYLFCSWGEYDKKQLRRDCDRHGVEYPFKEHWNLKLEFAKYWHQKMTAGQPIPRMPVKMKPYGLIQALQLLGLVFEGTHHRGIDDAKNIARITKTILAAQ